MIKSLSSSEVAYQLFSSSWSWTDWIRCKIASSSPLF